MKDLKGGALDPNFQSALPAPAIGDPAQPMQIWLIGSGNRLRLKNDGQVYLHCGNDKEWTHLALDGGRTTACFSHHCLGEVLPMPDSLSEL